MDQFILEIPDAFTSEYCQRVIEYFDACTAAGLGHTRQQDESAGAFEKMDTNLHAQENICAETTLLRSGALIRHFNDVFWQECYPAYVRRVPAIKLLNRHTIYYYKIQRTRPGEGYHVWHSEINEASTASRILAWTLYLNTVDEGGETEFLYQNRRVKAEVGKVVIWPAQFTYPHRGNPPLSGVKYIVTGWIEF
jgi:hypothetical protein